MKTYALISVIWTVLSICGWAVLPPEVYINSTPSSPVVGQTVTLDGSSSFDPDDPNVAIVSYSWTLLGQAFCISGVNASIAKCKFNAPGTYTVTLTAEDDEGLYTSEDHQVTVTAATNTLWYVRPDGSDDNDGSADSSSGAFRTIQTAIDSASDGDQIRVYGGVYYEQLYLKGKEVSIYSYNPANPNSSELAQNAIIDANKQGTAVMFGGSEPNSCQIRGFTIRGGFPTGDSLALHLDFNDPNTVALDSSGKERNGIVGGDPNRVVGYDGIVDGAMEFNGNNWIQIADYKGVAGKHPRSCAMWVKTTTAGAEMVLMSWGKEAAGQKWQLLIADSNEIVLDVQNGRVTGTTSINDGNWHHVAAVFEGNGTINLQDVELYVDGVQENTTCSNYVTTPPDVNTELDGDVYIGARTGTNPAYYTGVLDEVRIYSRVLAEGEIQQMAGCGGLMGHWTLDAITGDTVADSTSNNRIGTFNTASPTSTCSGGRIDHAIQLQNSEYIEIEDWTGITGGSSRSCSGWIRTSQAQAQLFSWGQTETGKKWVVRLNETGELRAEVQSGYIVGTTVLTDNKWHHIAVVLDSDGTPNISEVKLYVDGIRETTSSVLSYAINTSDTNKVQLGAYSPAPLYYTGWLDDMRIYDRALSENEIREMAGDVGLMAYWTLDETTGTTSADSSGNSINGTWQSSPQPSAEGYLGGALEFDGTDDYVSTSYNGVLGTRNRTVLAWIKALPDNSINLRSIVSWGSSVTGGVWNFCISTDPQYGTQGALRLGTYSSHVIGSTPINDNRWHHVAAVFENDGTPNTADIRLYVDGRQEVLSNTLPATLNTVQGDSVKIGVSGSLWLFKGRIDEVRIYDRALSNIELWQMYEESIGGGIAGHGALSNISHGIVTDNVSSGDGGGLSCINGDIINSLITKNAAANGGAISLCGGNLLNCTIADNLASVYGGGLKNCSGNVVNTIIWDNTDSAGQTQQSQIRDCTSTVSYSCVEGSTVYGGSANINDNPSFAYNSYHLNYDSPCIFTGDNSVVNWEKDLDGNPRLFNTLPSPESPLVDMGVYQVWNCVFPYNTSFETYQGYEETLNDWITSEGGSASIASYPESGYYTVPVDNNDLGYYHLSKLILPGQTPPEEQEYSYQYLTLSSGTVHREFEENSSRIVRIRCIPVTGASVEVCNEEDVIASVQFGTDGHIYVWSYTAGQYAFQDTGVLFTGTYDTWSAKFNTLDIDDYEGAWPELRIEFNWSENKYQVFWQDANITSNANFTEDDSAVLIGGVSSFTKIQFRNENSNQNGFKVNNVQVTNSNDWNPVFGEGQDIWIDYPVPAAGDCVEGHTPIWGSVWYPYLGEYQIKCCPTDLDPQEQASWQVVARGTQPRKNAILGYWDTYRFYNGDYYLKIEVYDDLHRLINETIQINGTEDIDEGIITKSISPNGTSRMAKVEYPVVGKAKGQTYHYEERPDVTINWPGSFPFEFRRIYDSALNNRILPLFFGWTHNHNIQIIENTGYEWVKDAQNMAIADQSGLGVGKLWLVQALGGKLFTGQIDSNDSSRVIYYPTDNEQDYVVRTSTWIAAESCFDVSYVHYAPDGMTMEFNHVGVYPEGALPANEGFVDWMVCKGIDVMADRFDNALTYQWKTDPNSGMELYLTEIANNQTPARIAFEDQLFGPGGISPYSKIQLSIWGNKTTLFEFSMPFVGEDTVDYSYRKCDNGDLAIDTPSLSCLRYQKENDSKWMLTHIDFPNVSPFPGVDPTKSSVLEYYSDGAIKKEWKHIQDSYLVGIYMSEDKYSYSFNEEDGCRITTQDTYVGVMHSCLLKTRITWTTAEGLLLKETIKTNDIKYDGKLFDPFKYFSEDFPAPVFDCVYFSQYHHYTGGGGVKNIEYIYGDENFPTKPTQIVESIDNEGDGTVDQQGKTITFAYDSRGNLIEQRVYAEESNFVLTQYAYHPVYNFPTRKTTWQGYCYEDGGQLITSGARVEKQWVYGRADGTLDPCDPNNKYLVQDWTLIDDKGTQTTQDDEWAVTYYEYHANGQIKTKKVLQDNTANAYAIDCYQYDPNDCFVLKEWNGAVLDNGQPVGLPQKRYYYNTAGFKELEADYLGKVTMYVLDQHGRVLQQRTYYDPDVMAQTDFMPSLYDSNIGGDDLTVDNWVSRTLYSHYDYYDKYTVKYLPTGGAIGSRYYNNEKTMIHWDAAGGAWGVEVGITHTGNPTAIHVTCDDIGVLTAFMYDSMDREAHKYEYNFNYYVASNVPNTFVKHTENTYYPSGQKQSERVYRQNLIRDENNNPAAGDRVLEKYAEYYYDSLDRMTQQVVHIQMDPADPNLDYVAPQITQIGYDAVGNQIYVIDPSGNVIFTDYDNANRKVQEYFAVPAAQAVYSTNGSLDVVQTKANAKIREMTQYYLDGKVKSVAQYDKDGTTILACSEYSYDGRGRIVQVKQAIEDKNSNQIIEDSVPGEKAVTTYTYRDVKDATALDPDIYHIKITDACSKKTLMTINPEGKIETVTYPSGDQEKYAYYCRSLTDPNSKFNGFLEAKSVWKDGDEYFICYEYDEFGKIKKIKYPYYTCQADYEGNPIPGTEEDCVLYEYTSRTLGELGKVKKITDYRKSPDGPGLAGQVYEFKYDPWSQNLVYYKNGDGYKLTYDYNAAFNRKSLVSVADSTDNPVYSMDYAYDLAGRMVTADANNIPLADFEYNANGNRQSLTYSLNTPSGLYGITYGYNADNMLTSLVTSGGAFYGFEASDAGDIDGLGRLNYASETLTYPGSGTTSRTSVFTYDMMSQLRQSYATNVGSLGWMRETFVYSEDGNIQQHQVFADPDNINPVQAFNYGYTDPNTAITGDLMLGASGTNPFGLTYDLNGNTTKLPTLETDRVEMNWDNKLRYAEKRVDPLRIDSVRVKYDPMGNRIWRESVVNGVAAGRKYVVDISGELPTILCEIEDPNSFVPGSLKKTYYYADEQILSQRVHDPVDPNSYTPYFYVHDRLGSVRMVVDDTGAAVCSYTYRPYGAFYEGECVETVGVDNPWKFTGQWYDVEIEQYYLRARQYDPQMMRFTSRDPLKNSPKQPLTINKYLYCLNDPQNNFDLDGKTAYKITDVLMAGMEMHAAAIGTAAYGANIGDWRFIGLGVFMEQLVSPAMALRMMSYRFFSGPARMFNADQQALVQIAKQAQKRGISRREAEIMLEWGSEYGLKSLSHMAEPSHWVGGPHIHIGPVNHIPVI